MKYAYIYNADRHLQGFVGPFDSYEDMMKDIAILPLNDDEGLEAPVEI